MRITRLLAGLVLLVAALGIGWLAARAALPPLLSARPDLANRFVPGNPDTVFRIATLDYARTRKPPPAADPAFIAQAAARSPLSADPFVFAAVHALAAGDGTRATRLLEEARHRNPRHRLARALLIERYVRESRPREAGVELATLNRLVPDASQVISDGMADLAARPATAQAVTGALRGDPAIDGVLLKMVQKGAAPGAVLALARNRGALPQSGADAWRGALLDRLVKAGDFTHARTLWRSFGGGSADAPIDAVFNPEFAALSAAPPFNWTLATGEVGAAELRKRGGLSVEFFGRASGPLVSQLMTLPPGRYRLQFVAEGDAKGTTSKLVWMVRCAAAGRAPGEGRALLSAVIAGVSGPPRRLGADFAVPADCPAQWLVLEGQASDFRDHEFVEITAFALRRAGAGQ